MKVIDLLNKIANGKVPKKIIVDNKFIYIHDGIDYKSHDGTYLFDSYIETTTEDMNIEIEIVEDTLEEEKKIPKKLEIEQDKPSSNYYIRNENGTKCGLTKHSKMIADTLNEIIDYLKSKGDE